MSVYSMAADTLLFCVVVEKVITCDCAHCPKEMQTCVGPEKAEIVVK